MMSTIKLNLSWVRGAAIWFVIVGLAAAAPSVTFAQDEVGPTYGNSDVLRFDPATGSLLVVAPDELKAYAIYNFFHPRLNRRVWSYRTPNGQFWHAFAEGTLQPIERFDFRLAPEDTLKQLRKLDPTLAYRYSAEGTRVHLQLHRDGRWTLYHGTTIPTIYDAETGRHWEQHFRWYTPVRHTGGYGWSLVNGQFVPAGH